MSEIKVRKFWVNVEEKILEGEVEETGRFLFDRTSETRKRNWYGSSINTQFLSNRETLYSVRCNNKQKIKTNTKHLQIQKIFNPPYYIIRKKTYLRPIFFPEDKRFQDFLKRL